MNKKITIHLASPRGFCAGVDRAIEIVKKTINKFGPPIYVRHEIVHNNHVVEDLKKQGVIFIEELEEMVSLIAPTLRRVWNTVGGTSGGGGGSHNNSGAGSSSSPYRPMSQSTGLLG